VEHHLARLGKLADRVCDVLNGDVGIDAMLVEQVNRPDAPSPK
jgi:hypothetical protein